MKEMDLESRMNRIIEWVKICDTKTSIILSVIVVLLTIIFTNETATSCVTETVLRNFDTSYYLYDGLCISGLFALLFLTLSCCSLFASLYSFVCVLYAKKKETLQNEKRGLYGRLESWLFFRKKVNNCSGQYFSSLIHFHHIAEMEYSDFRDIICNESDEMRKEDLISQIHINAIRCNEKYDLYNQGVLWFTISLVLGIISVIMFSVYFYIS